MKIFRGVISLLLIGFVLSCEAPRLNPLDPLNPDYILSSVEGVVQTASLPHQPLSGVKVFWKNNNILVETDAAGKFFIDQLPRNQGWLYFEKDGFSKDSSRITFNDRKIQLGEKYLNAIPMLDNLIFYTVIINRYPDQQIDSLVVRAKISDAENDVASVFIRCADLSINKSLAFNSASGYYEKKFTSGDLGLNSIDQGIGKNFEIIAIDKAGKEFITGTTTIKRTIRQDISFLSPANLAVVKKPVKFIWNRFSVGFNFNYILEIYPIDNSSVWKIQVLNIPKTDIEISAGTPEFNLNNLSPGEYFWVIWAIDDFGNKARSRPASFVIQ
ncbi:MAG: hypothetical protein CVV24_06645 [Ignavibacteriae bacterium HGW-Ignavibacteriae-3]|nr:MAG: hypothetical protein CVV24_06645 [Ignavibacteriae bacterium HGW-Ignavibacteriae-3]